MKKACSSSSSSSRSTGIFVLRVRALWSHIPLLRRTSDALLLYKAPHSVTAGCFAFQREDTAGCIKNGRCLLYPFFVPTLLEKARKGLVSSCHASACRTSPYLTHRTQTSGWFVYPRDRYPVHLLAIKHARALLCVCIRDVYPRYPWLLPSIKTRGTRGRSQMFTYLRVLCVLGEGRCLTVEDVLSWTGRAYSWSHVG